MTIVLVAFTCFVSYMAWERPGLLNKLSHHPYSESHDGAYYRLVSGGFVHGSWGHLGINMFVLYQFGDIVERLFTQMFGSGTSMLVFLVFYLSAIVVANLGTFFKHKNNPRFSSVGASGVTSALVFIYAIFDPWQMFLFPPIPAILFAILYVGYSTWASNNGKDNIDHMAHLYGGLYGVLFMLIAYPDTFNIFMNRLVDGWPL